MSIENLSVQQLRLAADLKEKIAALEKQLSGITGTSEKSVLVVAPKAAKPAKRKLSAAHLAKIRAALKLRWAKFNAAKAKNAPVAAKPAQKKFVMSAEARAKISAAA